MKHKAGVNYASYYNNYGGGISNFLLLADFKVVKWLNSKMCFFLFCLDMIIGLLFIVLGISLANYIIGKIQNNTLKFWLSLPLPFIASIVLFAVFIIITAILMSRDNLKMTKISFKCVGAVSAIFTFVFNFIILAVPENTAATIVENVFGNINDLKNELVNFGIGSPALMIIKIAFNVLFFGLIVGNIIGPLTLDIIEYHKEKKA